MATPQGSDPSPQLACQNSGGGVFTTRVSLRHTTMFTYSHATTPLGQSERAYYFSYFIKLFSKRQELCFSDATFKYCFTWWAYCFVGWKHGWKSRICLRSSWVAAWINYSECNSETWSARIKLRLCTSLKDSAILSVLHDSSLSLSAAPFFIVCKTAEKTTFLDKGKWMADCPVNSTKLKRYFKQYI